MLEGISVTSEYQPEFNWVRYQVRYRAMDGLLFTDVRFVQDEETYRAPNGVTVMLTPVFDSRDGHIVAMVYLIVDNGEIKARLKRVPSQDEDHFVMDEMTIKGPGIHPLPIVATKPEPSDDQLTP